MTTFWIVLTDIAVGQDRAAAPKLAFEIMVFDAEERPVTALDPNELALTLDGLYVPGTWQVQTFREARRAVMLGLLIPTHSNYSMPDDPDDLRETTPLDAVAAGVKTLLKGLSEQDRVAVFSYDEDGFKQLSSWSSPGGALDALRLLPGRTERARGTPHFYRSLSKAVSAFAHADEVSARRVLLTISDGVDPLVDKPALLKRETSELRDTAIAEGVHPWIVGFTQTTSEQMVWLKEIASKTKGRYHDVEDRAALSERVAAFGAAVGQGFVVTLTPGPGVRLPERAREVRLALRVGTNGGRVIRGPLTLRR